MGAVTADGFAAYADGVDDPRFTEWLRARSEPAWSDAVEHPFTSALADGSLDTDAFASYLQQDYAFVDALVSAFGYAVGQAPTIEAKRPLVEFLDTLTDAENDYFERSFEALDVSPIDDGERTETTSALVDLLGRAWREGGYAETLAVLVPAEWIYESWARGIDGSELPFYYSEWVELHALPSFVEFVAWLRGQLDAIGPTLSKRRQDRVDRLFARTVALEVAFFDDHYGGDA